MSLSRITAKTIEKKEMIPILEGIVSRVTAVNKNIEVIVFGSFVTKNEFYEDSDIDICILIDEGKPEEFLKDVYKFGPLSEWPTDLIVFRREEFDQKKSIGGIAFEINCYGKQLYPNWTLTP